MKHRVSAAAMVRWCPIWLTTLFVVLQLVSTSQDISEPPCGTPAITPWPPELVDARVVRAHSWPWQVYIEWESTLGSWSMHTCSGTIIYSNWVVTAAHCVSEVKNDILSIAVPSFVTVYVGGHDIGLYTKGMAVDGVVVHPGYQPQSKRMVFRSNNDIALLRMSKAIQYVDEVSRVCLPDGDVPVGTTCTATRWEKTGSAPSYRSNPLLQEGIPITNRAVCEQYFGSNFTDNMICAGNRNNQSCSSCCKGDSGGPLVSLDGVYVIHGIYSFHGENCTGSFVFTRVNNYIDWIQQYISGAVDITTGGTQGFHTLHSQGFIFILTLLLSIHMVY